MKYLIAKEDIFILDKLIFEKGEKIIKSEIYKVGDISIPHSMINHLLDDEKEINIKVKSLDDDEDEIKEWRLQLDVKTSRKKAKEIENILRETLRNYI